MRVFKTKWFERFAQKQGITNAELLSAIQQMEAGLIDANLGAGVFKQRVAKQGQGKSGGYRTIVVYRQQHIAFFVFGFEKTQQANLTDAELTALKQSASHYLALTDHQIHTLIAQQKLFVISNIKEEK